MLLQQVISRDGRQNYHLIAERCTQFLDEAQGLPLLKNLPTAYNDVHKVKCRKRNMQGDFVQTFNEAFSDCSLEIAQRAVFANGETSFTESQQSDQEPFFIFPVNEYKYLYSPEVDSSSSNYKQVLEVMFQQFGSEKGKTIVTEVLKFTYEHDKLVEGISKGCEIVFYDIPHYYGVRVSSTKTYNDLLTDILASK